MQMRDNKGAEPSHLVGGASGDCRLNIDPLDLVERNRVVSAVVKLGGARAFMRGHGLGVLQSAAGLEVGRKPWRGEPGQPDFPLKAASGGPPANNPFPFMACIGPSVNIPVLPA